MPVQKGSKLPHKLFKIRRLILLQEYKKSRGINTDVLLVDTWLNSGLEKTQYCGSVIWQFIGI